MNFEINSPCNCFSVCQKTKKHRKLENADFNIGFMLYALSEYGNNFVGKAGGNNCLIHLKYGFRDSFDRFPSIHGKTSSMMAMVVICIVSVFSLILVCLSLEVYIL